MGSSFTKPLSDGLMSDRKKEKDALAIRWLADRQLEDDDVQMEDNANDAPVPPFSFAPPSLVHCIITIHEARAHYMDIVREEGFWEA
ncbi:Sulfotransferase [Hordeum vulgare]|nr:Sulfotransferase [Hordeum vulgare]